MASLQHLSCVLCTTYGVHCTALYVHRSFLFVIDVLVWNLLLLPQTSRRSMAIRLRQQSQYDAAPPSYSLLFLLSLSLLLSAPPPLYPSILCPLASLSIPHTLFSSFSLYPSYSVLMLRSLSLFLCSLPSLSIPLTVLSALPSLSIPLTVLSALPSLSIPLYLYSSISLYPSSSVLFPFFLTSFSVLFPFSLNIFVCFLPPLSIPLCFFSSLSPFLLVRPFLPLSPPLSLSLQISFSLPPSSAVLLAGHSLCKTT